jgi:hypothetical protein
MEYPWISSTCRKIVYDKVQRVEYDKIRSSVAMFIVYVDYSSNHYIYISFTIYVSRMAKIHYLPEVCIKDVY